MAQRALSALAIGSRRFAALTFSASPKKAQRAPFGSVRRSGLRADAVLCPAAVDERPDLVAHHDLLGPLAGALLGALVGRVDAQFPAVELPRRGVVEVVERALG